VIRFGPNAVENLPIRFVSVQGDVYEGHGFAPGSYTIFASLMAEPTTAVEMGRVSVDVVDGANRFRAVVYVVLPLALPGLVATGIFTFILAWNDYIFTRILISSDELKTLPVGVQDLFHSALIDWGLIMAAGVLITIPALAFFAAVQRHLVAGWGGGGLKG